jgi:hypothetical protein
MTVRKIGEYTGPDGRVVLRRWRIEERKERGATMSNPLNDERLEEIRAQTKSATPGPWSVLADIAGGKVFAWMIREPQARTLYPTDAVFIADARLAIPELLDEVDRLRAENDHLRAQLARVMPIVEAVAEGSILRHGDEFGLRCSSCDADLEMVEAHKPGCLLIQARAAMEQGQEASVPEEMERLAEDDLAQDD